MGASGGPMAIVRGELEYRELADGGMIYDPQTQRIHHLNSTAARIWQACQAGRSRAEAVGQLCAEFEVAQEDASRDLERVLAEFAAAHLFQA